MVVAALLGAWAISAEIEASPVQARIFSRLADQMKYSMVPGESVTSRFPASGPYDDRLGYSQLPAFIEALKADDFIIDRQARLSPAMARFIDLGGFPIFPEKAQAGLSIYDQRGREIYLSRHPERLFPSFSAIPPMFVATLLFVENRELLDATYPTRNPAIEWDRFALASVNALSDKLSLSSHRFGGSTLATQIEKYRHSPSGRTGSAGEKLQQMLSASVRAYADGPETFAARHRIVLDYMNSTPLSARPGFGEIIGLGDGLWAWYGTDLNEVVRLFGRDARTPADRFARATVYKQALSLMLAQRRPSYYLLAGRDDLRLLTDTHLRLLADAGIIDTDLRDDAIASDLEFRREPPAPTEISFLDRKAANAIRAHLSSLLGVRRFYDLDRLDLRAEATLDLPTQQAVIDVLRRLNDPEQAAQLGLIGERLLDKRQVAGVVYSLTLYERGRDANYVRVQADTLDRPLDLNEGGKLDLGSTAKLRTLTSYLQVIAELHQTYAQMSRAELGEAAGDAIDPLSRWAIQYLQQNADRSLQGLVDAAMERRYSASPGEAFFTGSGLHTFANFDKTHDTRIMTVWEAFRYSVNLPFIRMMRDIVRYHMAAAGDGAGTEILKDGDHPARQDYLRRFADKEGRVFISRFYARYRGKTPNESLELLAGRTRPAAHRLATVYRSVRPDDGLDAFARFMRRRLPAASLSDAEMAKLYSGYGIDRFNLHDRGYIARLHPLELWLVAYLQRQPAASRGEVMAASVAERQEVYAWLLKSKRKGAADSRIRILLEEEAFARLHQTWEALGYPFPTLVPSLATAIGSSADRPQALAELIGIILNDGVRLPTIRVDAVHFAERTPFETHMVRAPAEGERLLPAEVAATLRKALVDVGENGTARRIAGAFTGANGTRVAVGGKTGTGDEMADRYARGSAAAREKEVSRSAAFVFFIGSRFFGVVTAHVPGDRVGEFKFTSALPTQVLKSLAPALQPLIDGEPQRPAPLPNVVATTGPVIH
ncbi:MAG: transglycosylase domain-containing protein [Rhodospirillales bacterium]|nr:transglycosylase domain-containing protein [Rhodospirillales bacterium]